MDDLACTNCGEYVGSPIADRIAALEARIAKADALAGAAEGCGNWMASLHSLIEESDCNPDDVDFFDDVLRGVLMFVNRLEEELAAYRATKEGGA